MQKVEEFNISGLITVSSNQTAILHEKFARGTSELDRCFSIANCDYSHILCNDIVIEPPFLIYEDNRKDQQITGG